MTSLITQDLIEATVKVIRSRIKNHRVYGKEIDLNNLDDVLVAAYHLGMLDVEIDFTKLIKPMELAKDDKDDQKWDTRGFTINRFAPYRPTSTSGSGC